MKKIIYAAVLSALLAACSSTPETQNAAPVDELFLRFAALGTTQLWRRHPGVRLRMVGGGTPCLSRHSIGSAHRWS